MIPETATEDRPPIAEGNGRPSTRRTLTEVRRSIVEAEALAPGTLDPGAINTRRASVVGLTSTPVIDMARGSNLSNLAEWEEERPKGLLKCTPQWLIDAASPPETWGPCRSACGMVLNSNFPMSDQNIFDTVIGVVIVYNVWLMVIETDQMALCRSDRVSECIADWVREVNIVLLVIYTLEVMLRLQVQRALFFFQSWNILDFFIVLTGFVGLGVGDSPDISKFQMLRGVRIVRLVRVAKLLNRLTTLRSMIRGFHGAMSAMLWGLVLILILLIIWSILAVEFVNPVSLRMWRNNPTDDNEFCADAFTSVLRSTLLFFQTLVAGDSWGRCAVPIMQEDPSVAIIFALSLVSVQLGFTNLVLAIIVDKASESRQDTNKKQQELQRKQEAKSMEMWRNAMVIMDKDNSGSVSLEELIFGYEDPTVREALESMRIHQSDLQMLFDLLDTDGSGTVSPDEFMGVFHKAYTQDWRGYLMMMRLQLNKMNFRSSQKLDKLESLVRRLLHQQPAAAPAALLLQQQQRPAAETNSRIQSGSGSQACTGLEVCEITPTRSPELSGCGILHGCVSGGGEEVSLIEVAEHDHIPEQGLSEQGSGDKLGSTAGAKTLHAGSVHAATPPNWETAADLALDDWLLSELRSINQSLENQLEALRIQAGTAAELLARQGRLLQPALGSSPTSFGTSMKDGDCSAGGDIAAYLGGGAVASAAAAADPLAAAVVASPVAKVASPTTIRCNEQQVGLSEVASPTTVRCNEQQVGLSEASSGHVPELCVGSPRSGRHNTETL